MKEHTTKPFHGKSREAQSLNFFDSFAYKKYMSTQKLSLRGSVLGITVPTAAIQTGQGDIR